MSFKEAYEMKMDCQIGEWTDKIEKLRARAEQAGDEQKTQYREYIKNLGEKKENLQKKLDELRATKEVDWEEVRGGVDVAWGKLKDAVELVDEAIP